MIPDNLSTTISKQLYESDSLFFNRLFTVLLLMLVGSMVAVAFTYGWESQAVPLIIGIPGVALILMLLSLQTSDRAKRFVERITESNSLLSVEDELSDIDMGDNSEVATKEARTRLTVISGWMIFFFFSLFIFGFDFGILISLLAIYRFYAGLSWLRAIIYSLVIWLSIIVIFNIALRARMYEGVLGLHIF